MSNPLWVPGKSGNPEGARRHSVRTPKGMILAFIKKNISPTKLGKLYESLNEKDKISVLLELLPYVVSKAAPDSLSSDEIESLFSKLETVLKATADGNSKSG
jgi:hypothetical protein